MREKFLPRRLAFLIIVRGRGQREILKNPRPAGSWQPFKSIFGERKKDRPQRAASPVLSVLCTGKPERGKSAAVTEQVCGSYRASFYHGAKIRNSAVLPLAGNLLGSAFPKPCYGGLRRKNISVRQAAFLREPRRKYLTDQPIFCDKWKEVYSPCRSDTTRPTAAAL